MPSKETIVPLLALPAPWSAQSGLPEATVFRRLCEWAMCGAFPENAFRNMHDEPIPTFDIFMSERALREDRTGLSSSVRLGNSGMSCPRWGAECLRSALLRLADLEIFCAKTNTEPFWTSRSVGFWSFFRPAKRRSHLAPPPCPDAELYAIRFDASGSAESRMNWMSSKLRRWQGKDERWNRWLEGLGEKVDPTAYDFAELGREWETDVDDVKRSIERAGDEKLMTRLHELNAEWQTFCRNYEPQTDLSPAGPCAGVDLQLFPNEFTVNFRGAAIDIPEKQFKLLLCLAEAALEGRNPLMREIENRLWGNDLHKVGRPVSDVVRDLRGTLRAGGASSESEGLIRNRAGKGYFLDLPASAVSIERTPQVRGEINASQS